MTKALQGLKVLELGQLIAGPFATRLLAEFGAEVIKIEPPGSGDPLRAWRKLHDGTSLWWYVQSRNKKSVGLDLRHPEGQAIVRKLAASADVVIENFRPGTLERWNLSYEALSADNPGLIMVRVSGYGQSGPLRDQAGFGAVGESMGGLRYITGYDDRPPVRSNLSIGDTLAALHGVIGALLALHHRVANGGRGQVIDVALYESVFNVMESTVSEFAADGTVRERTGSNLSGVVPSNTYQTRDGVHVVIAGNGDSIFKRLMNTVGRADLADDPALATNAGRAPRADELDEAIGAWCARHEIGAVLDALQAAQVPHGKIYSAADIFNDPHYRARGMLIEETLPDGTPITIPGIVPKLSETPGSIEWIGPKLGQHTAEVLGGIGYTAADVERLHAGGVVHEHELAGRIPARKESN